MTDYLVSFSNLHFIYGIASNLINKVENSEMGCSRELFRNCKKITRKKSKGFCSLSLSHCDEYLKNNEYNILKPIKIVVGSSYRKAKWNKMKAIVKIVTKVFSKCDTWSTQFEPSSGFDCIEQFGLQNLLALKFWKLE